MRVTFCRLSGSVSHQHAGHFKITRAEYRVGSSSVPNGIGHHVLESGAVLDVAHPLIDSVNGPRYASRVEKAEFRGITSLQPTE